ncbi:MAG: N-acetyl sugar amidotransferase [Deltaproteobacteria bacterium]|nr:N-acetyl sugar amidotransferase [Deltaproteobacteria bacterium]
MRYCTKCVMPDTKPDLQFDEEGVCSACRYLEKRPEIDWDARKNELRGIVEKYKNKSKRWDCVIPVSGGKDSHYQVIKLKEMGINPLCVTATTCDLSDIGRRNIENIKNLGVDLLEFTPNPQVRRKINRIGLEQVGDISWPEHVTIFTIPVQVAVQYEIPLIVWGENSQNEYGGPASDSDNNLLTRRWLEEFGGLLGLRVSDLVGLLDITEQDLQPYIYPTDDELKKVGVTGIFLGYYLPWDGYSNALLAQAFGFETFSHSTETSMVNYENLDNHQAGIHEYFKYLKFGFGRASDVASLHIRRGRLTRKEGMDIVRERDGKFPWTYLGKDLETIIRPLDLTLDEFMKLCDRFTNKKIFVTDNNGQLVKDKYGQLTKLKYDNE